MVVGPMARFITGSCCEDSTHAANRANNDFYNKMREEAPAAKTLKTSCLLEAFATAGSWTRREHCWA